MRRLIYICLSVVVVITGCASSDPQRGASALSAVDLDAIAAAVADVRRPAADRARDAGRKPQAVLEFAGLGPGMSVLDMYAGGGYYSELAAYVVGSTGRVVAYNNTAYNTIAAKQIATRYADGRLPAVEQLVSSNNQLQLPAAAFDVALFILSYHDVYYLDGERGWEKIDRPRLLAEVFKAMKPGGRVIVADHVATPGMAAETVRALHRIDPELIKADFKAAGFRYDTASAVLRNPDDDFDVIAMAPNVRGRTDRALLRFIRP